MTLPFTPAGSRLLISLVDSLTPLEVTYGEGSLAGRLELRKLRLTLDSVDIQLHGIELHLAPSCLVYSKICLNRIALDSLDIGIFDGEPGEDQSTAVDSALFRFPFALEAETLSIQKIFVHWATGDWSNGAITGSLAIAGSQIFVRSATVEDPYLRLTSSPEDEQEQTLAIELPQLHLPLELILEELNLERPGWSFDELNHQHESLLLSGRWQGSTLAIQSLSLSSADWGQVSLSGDLELTDEWPIEVQADATLDQPPLWAGFHQRDVHLGVSGTLGDLQVSAEMPGLQSYQLTGRVNSLNRSVPFDVQLEAGWSGSMTPGDIPGVASDFTEIQLASPWLLNAAGSIESQTFTLQGTAAGFGYTNLDLIMSGQHTDSEVTLESVELGDKASDSSLTFGGRVSLGDTLRWDLSVNSDGVDLPAISESVEGRMNGTLLTRGEVGSGHWRVALESVALQGEINDTPAEVSGKVELDSQLQLRNSDLNVLANSAKLNLIVMEQSPPQVDLVVADLGLWLSDSGGSLNLSSELQDSQRQFVFRGDAKNLVWQGTDIGLGRFEGNYSLDDTQEFDVSVELEQLVYEDWKLVKPRLAVTGNEQSQSLKLTSAGDVETDIRVKGSFDGDTWSGVLRPTSLGTPVGLWQLDGPVDLLWKKASGGLEIEAHCWRSADARVCPGRLVLAGQGGGSIEIESDLHVFDPLIPQNTNLTGIIKASLEAQWAPDTGMIATGNIKVSQGNIARLSGEGERAAVGWDKASIHGNFDDNGLSLNGEVWRDNRQQLQLDLLLPKEKQQALEGQLSLDSFALTGILKPFLTTLSDHSGVVNGTLDFSGTAQDPLINGELVLSDGQFSLIGNPTAFEQLNLTITATGERADLEGGLLIGGGDTRVTGSLLVHPQPRLELSIAGDRQTLLLPPGMEATVSENLNLVSTNGHLDIQGEITVHEGVLEHEQLPPGGIDVSADVVEVDARGEVVSEQAPLDFAADVRVNILDAFQVVGTGLTTTVGGELNLKREISQPLQLFGELNILEGEIDVFGQELKIRKGNISFVGEPGNPDLNLRADREIRDESIIVGVDVLGNLKDFSFNLYSTPNLSEAEMMSYLVRGRGLDQGAEADGAAVALALGLGAVNRTSIVEGINNIQGISNLSFATEGEAEQTTATVGAYVGERLYLAYGVGIYEPINVLTTRLYLQSQLWLEVVSSLESSADIYYAFDIK